MLSVAWQHRDGGGGDGSMRENYPENQIMTNWTKSVYGSARKGGWFYLTGGGRNVTHDLSPGHFDLRGFCSLQHLCCQEVKL